MKSNITFSTDRRPTLQQILQLYMHCSLGERRPISDPDRMQAMVDHANLVIYAWHDDRLVGIARCMTDFVFTTYLADLAVDEQYQNMGIGKQLIKQVQDHTDKECTIILLAAPQATEYYPHIGFEEHHSAWLLKQPLK